MLSLSRGLLIAALSAGYVASHEAVVFADDEDEGGDEGGRVIAEGPPEVVAKTPESRTGAYVARALTGAPPASNLLVGSTREASRRRRG